MYIIVIYDVIFYNDRLKGGVNLFRSRLKELRQEKGLNQSEVAEALGVATMTISNYEQGIRTPDCDFIIKAADFFNVSADYILLHSNIKQISRKNISKTGLSDMAAERLLKWKDDKNLYAILIVNLLIENPLFYRLCEAAAALNACELTEADKALSNMLIDMNLSLQDVKYKIEQLKEIKIENLKENKDFSKLFNSTDVIKNISQTIIHIDNRGRRRLLEHDTTVLLQDLYNWFMDIMLYNKAHTVAEKANLDIYKAEMERILCQEKD